MCSRNRLATHANLLGRSISQSLRDGDIQLKQFMKFNAGMRTERKQGMIETDANNRPFVEVRVVLLLLSQGPSNARYGL